MVKPLRIGLVLDDSLDRSQNGVQQYVLTLGRWLLSQGHEVTWLVGETNQQTELSSRIRSLSHNIEVSVNGNRVSIPLPTGRKTIRQALAEGQFDILHVQMPCSPFMAGRLIHAASPTTAVVGTFHIVAEGWWEQLGSRLLGFWQRSTLQRFDQVLSVSDSAHDFAKRYFGIESLVVPNVVDVSHFHTTKASKPEKLLLYLGRLVKRKGCQYLIAALTQLHEERQLEDWSVVIASDGPLRPQLEKQVQAAGLQSAVRFAGFVTEETKVALLQRAALAVYPSTGNESFGIVLIEAMAAHAPVVLGGDNVGYRFVLGPQANALLVNPRDTDQFAKKLHHLMSDDELRRQLLRWQQARIRDFDVMTVGPRIEVIYRAAQDKRVALADKTRHTNR